MQAGVELREHLPSTNCSWMATASRGIRGHTRVARQLTEQARMVVGADGLRSVVARSVQAPTYNHGPRSPAPTTRTGAMCPTWCGAISTTQPDDHHRADQRRADLVVVFWPNAAFHEVRADIEGHFMQVPGHRARPRRASAHGHAASASAAPRDLPYFLRQPYGPGWALVGDAGYHKDPITGAGHQRCLPRCRSPADAIDAG